MSEVGAYIMEAWHIKSVVKKHIKGLNNLSLLSHHVGWPLACGLQLFWCQRSQKVPWTSCPGIVLQYTMPGGPQNITWEQHSDYALHLTHYAFSCRRWLFWKKCSAKVLPRMLLFTPPILWVECSIHCMGEHAWVSWHKYTRAQWKGHACVKCLLITACIFLQWIKSSEHLFVFNIWLCCVKLHWRLWLLLRYNYLSSTTLQKRDVCTSNTPVF